MLGAQGRRGGLQQLGAAPAQQQRRAQAGKARGHRRPQAAAAAGDQDALAGQQIGLEHRRTVLAAGVGQGRVKQGEALTRP